MWFRGASFRERATRDQKGLYLRDGLANEDDKLANGSHRLGTSECHFRD
jgi:hypothetical protein